MAQSKASAGPSVTTACPSSLAPMVSRAQSWRRDPCPTVLPSWCERWLHDSELVKFCWGFFLPEHDDPSTGVNKRGRVRGSTADGGPTGSSGVWQSSTRSRHHCWIISYKLFDACRPLWYRPCAIISGFSLPVRVRARALDHAGRRSSLPARLIQQPIALSFTVSSLSRLLSHLVPSVLPEGRQHRH